jgi:hypothetical protein
MLPSSSALHCPAPDRRVKVALRASLRDRLRRTWTRRPLARDRRRSRRTGEKKSCLHVVGHRRWLCIELVIFENRPIPARYNVPPSSTIRSFNFTWIHTAALHMGNLNYLDC